MDELTREALARSADKRLRALVEQVCDITGMGFAAVARVTEHRWIACQVEDRIELGLDPGDELDIKTTICNDIRQSGQAVVIDHVAADPAWRTHPIPMLYGFESYVSLPITLPDGSFFGTLCAIDPQPRTLSAGTLVSTLRELADQVASLITPPPATSDGEYGE